MFLDNECIKFGPSGSCEDFAASGYKHTKQIPQWLIDNDLDCFEYSFGRGIMLKEETALELAKIFKEANKEISVHAPYFINLATLEEEKALNNRRYIFDSLHMLKCLGGRRAVFHPGAPCKRQRTDAMNTLFEAWEKILEEKHTLGFDDVFLCPETMGKVSQLGDLDEIIAMCKMGDDTIVPCVDWGHLNSRDCGVFFTKDDYKRAIDKMIDGIGERKTRNMHIHFSKIQFTSKGELRHLTFDDNIYGPPYEPLLEVLHDYKLHPYIVCESAGKQTRDAKTMKTYYKNL